MTPFRLLTRLLLLLALGWGAFLVLGKPGAGRAAIGVHNPCLEPLTWRVGEIDARFDLTPEALAEAVRAAVAVWEEPTGMTLFRQDPAGAMPVHLIFDERQAEFRADEDRRGELAQLEAEVGRVQTDFNAGRRAFDEAAALHRSFAERLDARIQAHNARVQEWNSRGGAPEAEAGRLREEGDRIAREQAELLARARSLEEARRQLEADGRRLEQAGQRYNRRVEELRAESPGRVVSSATFEIETVMRGSRVTDVRRWINVFQFSTPEHLVFLLAHELGHALGLDHAGDPLAIMREEHTMDQMTGNIRLQPADRELLLERCRAVEAGAGGT